MEIQHVRVKVPLESTEGVDFEEFIRVFHAWIRDGVCEELAIDVADYRHVRGGPDVLLIAHEADYGIDSTGDVTGLFYLRKDTVADGDGPARVRRAFESLMAACDRLEKDERFGGALSFDRKTVEISINDRLVASNTAGSFAELESIVRGAFEGIWGAGKVASVEHTSASEPRSLLTAVVRAAG